ncbi:hypothetical protein HK097_007224 [Rhizophlyctis rosea]|uniref:LIM zinc-binding domain-containing protein n=1 Tax=Rhizophlyctis rosea TaxID=64517 RepID=A0AAD5SBY0_9FUNG|nr:hypothetical protein HK097_007224 [Rhizophlyctis rosea]
MSNITADVDSLEFDENIVKGLSPLPSSASRVSPQITHKSSHSSITKVPAVTSTPPPPPVPQDLPKCIECKDPIVGAAVSAMGKTWHPNHFLCTSCKCVLGTGRFFEKEDQAYCETCYHDLFSPKCAYCSEVISDRCITALGSTWHPEHFFCCQCGKLFPPGAGFLEKDGMAYCEDDYFNLFAMKCAGCKKGLVGEYVSACGKEFHPGCFVCAECKQPFPSGTFFEQDGAPYCEAHFQSRRGAVACSGCQRSIGSNQQTVTALGGKKFHLEHFGCGYCGKVLMADRADEDDIVAVDGDGFREREGKAYCLLCSTKLFG